MQTILKKGDSQFITKKSSLVSRQVVLRTIEDVMEGDFNQARITMEAWEKVGWNSGKAVANALADGHGYKIKEIVLKERFSERVRDILRETRFASNILLTYNVLIDPNIKLIGSKDNPGMELVLPSKDLVVKENDSKTIEMTAIVKGKLPQIGSSNLRLT